MGSGPSQQSDAFDLGQVGKQGQHFEAREVSHLLAKPLTLVVADF
jgi:hypothetical protein